MTGIVSADHQHRYPRVDAIYFAMLKPPQYIFSTITAVTQVNGVATGIEFFPGRFSFILPALSNRVADHQQIHITLLDALQFFLVTRLPPAARPELIQHRGGYGYGFIIGDRKSTRLNSSHVKI